ncbi:MAG: leader peptidase (prepilin peptidase)/N-methyltransferase [Gammaproteobacteria bacterium]|jgi:leader peptidase (prepilin peptidase)/N-methyltransferase
MSLIHALQVYPSMLILGSVILGLLVGSFLNVVIYRLPLMMEREWKSECRVILELDPQEPSQTGNFNLAHPNSHCPNCNASIKPWQNIPVVSYLLLKGSCANCHTPISIRYPIVEALTGLLSGIIAWQLGDPVPVLLALFFTWTLISLTMIDADHQLLPDQITLPLLWAGLAINSFGVFVPLVDAFWGAVIGYLSLWSVYWLFKLVTGKEGMGYGDFKLLAALGAWMGWQSLLTVILMSSLVGAVVGSIILLINKKGRNTAIPFGPYLAAAGWITLVWGDQIAARYFQLVSVQ